MWERERAGARERESGRKREREKVGEQARGRQRLRRIVVAYAEVRTDYTGI